MVHVPPFKFPKVGFELNVDWSALDTSLAEFAAVALYYQVKLLESFKVPAAYLGTDPPLPSFDDVFAAYLPTPPDPKNGVCLGE